MRYLLDTHILLWHVHGDSRLTQSVLGCLNDPSARLSVSIASLWELAISESLGKLKLSGGYRKWSQIYVFEQPFEIVSIEPRHLAGLTELPHHHGDPFDRLLICQAMETEMTLVSNDKVFRKYDGLEVVW